MQKDIRRFFIRSGLELRCAENPSLLRTQVDKADPSMERQSYSPKTRPQQKWPVKSADEAVTNIEEPQWRMESVPVKTLGLIDKPSICSDWPSEWMATRTLGRNGVLRTGTTATADWSRRLTERRMVKVPFGPPHSSAVRVTAATGRYNPRKAAASLH